MEPPGGSTVNVFKKGLKTFLSKVAHTLGPVAPYRAKAWLSPFPSPPLACTHIAAVYLRLSTRVTWSMECDLCFYLHYFSSCNRIFFSGIHDLKDSCGFFPLLVIRTLYAVVYLNLRWVLRSQNLPTLCACPCVWSSIPCRSPPPPTVPGPTKCAVLRHSLECSHWSNKLDFVWGSNVHRHSNELPSVSERMHVLALSPPRSLENQGAMQPPS